MVPVVHSCQKWHGPSCPLWKNFMVPVVHLVISGWSQLSTYVKNGMVPVVHGTSCPTFFVTAYAALRPRDGFSHPLQEHMKYTYILFGSKQRLKDNPIWMSNVIESSFFVKYLRRTIDPCLSFESMANTIIKEANSHLIVLSETSFIPYQKIDGFILDTKSF